MAVLFFFVTIVGSLFTLNAFLPARRFWPLVGAGFFASWLTGELSAHHIFWQVIATVVFVRAGALNEPIGFVGLGVAALSWGGLFVLIMEANRAKKVMDSALREGLGEHYYDKILEEQRPLVNESWGIRQRLFPLPIWDPRVERIRNIVFHEAGGIRLKLDIYRAKNFKPGCPVVLHVHGGAWMVGSKDDQGKPQSYRLAAHGWLVVSANYRLSPRFSWPDHIIDVKAAIKWIREHGAEFGGDPRFIAITGGSAGGHLAALAALTANDPQFQPGFEEVDTTVQACVPFYGVYDFTDRLGIWKHSLLRPMLERRIFKKRFLEARETFEKASPVTRVNALAPPFLLVHGTRDTLVPIEELKAFVEVLRATSKAPVCAAALPGAQHAFEIFPSRRTGYALAFAERFLTFVLNEWRSKNAKEKRD